MACTITRTGPSRRRPLQNIGAICLDAIEKAVRNALEKGDAEDKNYRRRVYVSARSALERSMAGRQLEQDLVDQRFSRLAEVAATIESEFLLAVEEFQYPMPGRRSYEAPPPSVDGAPDEPASADDSPAQDTYSIPAQDTGAQVEAEPAAENVSSQFHPANEDETAMEQRSEESDAFSPADAEPHPAVLTATNEEGPLEDVLAQMPSPEEVVADAPMVPAVTGAGRRKASTKTAASLDKEQRASEDVPQAGIPDLFGIAELAGDAPAALPESGDLSNLSPDEMSGLSGPEPFAETESLAASGAEQPAPISAETLDLFEAESQREASPAFEVGELTVENATETPGAADAAASSEVEVPIGDSELPVIEESSHAVHPATISTNQEADGTGAGADPAEQGDQHFEVRPVVASPEIAMPDSPNSSAASKDPAIEPRRGWAFVFIMVTLLAILTMGLWVAYSTGTLKLRSAENAQSGDVVTVDPRDEPDPSGPGAGQSSGDDWLMIFRPDNPGDLVVDPTIRAEIAGTGPLAHLRIEPAASSSADSAVVFSIGKGILEQIAGKSAVFDIVAAADDGNPTQISVLCDFAGFGDCGRMRYRIDAATSDNLFQVEFPEGTPDGDGQIIINPDVDGKGRALEVYAIRVRIADK